MIYKLPGTNLPQLNFGWLHGLRSFMSSMGQLGDCRWGLEISSKEIYDGCRALSVERVRVLAGFVW